MNQVLAYKYALLVVIAGIGIAFAAILYNLIQTGQFQTRLFVVTLLVAGISIIPYRKYKALQSNTKS